MLRHTFRVRSALKHFRSAPYQTATRLLHDSDGSSPTYDHASIDRRFNKLQSEMRDTDDKLRGLGDKLAMEVKVLGDNLAVLGKELSMKIKILGRELSMEIKNLGTTMDARFETSNAKTQSKFEMLRTESRDREARFWARIVFTVVAVAGLTTSAAFLQYQNRAIQTHTIQTPAIQTPAVQAPMVGQK